MATVASNAREPNDRRWFRLLLMRILAERTITQYWLATRAHLAKTTLNKLVNGRRSPTEAQALLAGAGLICTNSELQIMQSLLDARWNRKAGPALAALMSSCDATVTALAHASGIGTRIIDAFISGELHPGEAELLRLFVAAVVRDDRLGLVNALLEAARYHTIRPPADDAHS